MSEAFHVLISGSAPSGIQIVPRQSQSVDAPRSPSGTEIHREDRRGRPDSVNEGGRESKVTVMHVDREGPFAEDVEKLSRTLLALIQNLPRRCPCSKSLVGRDPAITILPSSSPVDCDPAIIAIGPTLIFGSKNAAAGEARVKKKSQCVDRS
jgi:hypothetical protein